MKYFLIALVALIIIGYFYIKNALSKFTFGDVKFVGGDIKSIFNGTGFTAINLSSTIANGNNFSIPVSGLYIELYYQGQLIGKSVAPHADFVIPDNGSITITESMVFNIKNGISIAANILSGKPVTFDYKINAKLFGFYPLQYTGNFVY